MKTSLASAKDAVHRARRLRWDSTPAERALWARLRDRQFLGLKFRRQVPIGPYVADFYCDPLKLILELDGGVHEAARQKKHDENRAANLTALGYVILRFTNQQALENPESIFMRIAEFLESPDPEHYSPSSPSGRGGPGR